MSSTTETPGARPSGSAGLKSFCADWSEGTGRRIAEAIRSACPGDVRGAYVVGSYTFGTREPSDMDILVVVDKDFFDVEEYAPGWTKVVQHFPVGEHLETLLGVKVDLFYTNEPVTEANQVTESGTVMPFYDLDTETLHNRRESFEGTFTHYKRTFREGVKRPQVQAERAHGRHPVRR